jgi:tRNA-specific 2-thiouridylase
VTKKAHGIGLLSGGLDSALAALVVRDAGVQVTCLHFFTGFCVTGHNSRVGRKNRPIANHALQVAADIGIDVELVDISDEYLSLVMRPKYGYGANMNPCVDCRIFMLRQAKAYMEKVGADFVFTGEVVGQRRMTQTHAMCRLIAREAGLKDRLLRPLSAKFLDPTDVERTGLVDREKLCRIHGRGRKRQLELAAQYGITGYMQPAGGCCFLTDESYSHKLRDLLRAQGGDRLSMDDVYLLGVGRHFRLSPRLKVIVGRNEAENNFLNQYASDHVSARAMAFNGPAVIVMGEPDQSSYATIASLAARYCDGKQGTNVAVEFQRSGERWSVEAAPAEEALLESLRI